MNERLFRRRVFTVGILLAAATLFIIYKLAGLHFTDKIIISPPGSGKVKRGALYDRHGALLAVSVETESVFANPEEITDASAAAGALAPILGVNERALAERLTMKKRFVWIRRKIGPELAARIEGLNIKGVYVRKEYQRVYPHGTLAANILGFTDIDGHGLEGIEFSSNGILGKNPLQPDSGQGRSIKLTIDRYIQHTAETEIAAAVTAHRANQGAILVMEVKTGRILALAKYPPYDPNNFQDYSSFIRRNFSVIDSFEPGSTMKIFSAASLLERNEAAVKRQYTCTGSIEIADVTINCIKPHGTLAYPSVISHSCNSGVVQSVKGMKAADLHGTLVKFGFGKKTGAGFPGESEGLLRTPDKWSGISKYSISIGYEISVTSLQLAAAFNAIANRGVYMNPSIIESIESPDGIKLMNYYPTTRGRVISEKNAAELMSYMKGVVTEGTGTLAASAYYQTGGKTGTAKKASIRGKGYTDRSMSSFIGIAPWESPAVCVLVVLDDSEERLTGGQIAAPVFSKVTDSILPYMGVKTPRQPSAPARTKYPPFADTGLMPDLTSRSLPDTVLALYELKRLYGADYRIEGTGRVFSQIPEKGVRLSRGTVIVVRMKER